jgi:hypothetical protein
MTLQLEGYLPESKIKLKSLVIALQETNIIVNPDDDVRIPCTVISHGPVMMMWTGFSKDGNFLNPFLYFNWLLINSQLR